MAMAPIVSLLIIEQKAFCLSASPDKQKILSLCPRRLCGENVILDKHDLIMTINVTSRFNSRTDVLRYLINLNKFDKITCFWRNSCRTATKSLSVQ